MKSRIIELIGSENTSKIRRWLFTKVRGYSFRLLNLLDPTFATNVRFNLKENFKINTNDLSGINQTLISNDWHIGDANNPNYDSIPTANVEVPVGPKMSSVVVLSTEDSVASIEAIQFLISGIFKDPESCHYIIGGIDKNIDGGQTIAEIENLICSFLEEKLESHLHNTCREVFKLHQFETIENARSYSTKSRSRPSAIYWPNPTDPTNMRSIYNELPYVLREEIVRPHTAVGSAGSCFASEIALALQADHFNYVVTEPNVGIDGSYRFMTPSEKPVSCAAWGTIFNTPSFKQLVEKSFEERYLPKILWNNRRDGVVRFYDPFRENIEFTSPDAFEENYEKHKEAARQAFLELEVFVITLGLNEVWYFKADGSAFSRSPWRIAPSLVERRILTVEENVNDLQRMLDILRVHNPNIKLIVTLSPVGLHATFRGDTHHIIAANSHSKSVLRVAAEEFVSRNKDVYYFPSYEVINFCTINPYLQDQRNISSNGVENVMRLFKEMYVAR